MVIPDEEFWRELFEIYQNMPVLWDFKNKVYKNKKKKTRAWDILLEKFREFDPYASKDTLKNRINNLRSCCRREFRKVKQSLGSGSQDVIYVPKLWYYKYFEPIMIRELEREDEYVQNASTNDSTFEYRSSCTYNDGPSDEIDENELDFFGSDLSKQSTGNRRSKRRYSASEPSEEFTPKDGPSNYKHRTISRRNYLKSIDRHARHRTRLRSRVDHEDEADIFGKSWAICYRKLSEVQKIYAKRAIEEILTLGQLNRLSIDTVTNFADLMQPIEDNGMEEELTNIYEEAKSPKECESVEKTEGVEYEECDERELYVKSFEPLENV